MANEKSTEGTVERRESPPFDVGKKNGILILVSLLAIIAVLAIFGGGDSSNGNAETEITNNPKTDPVKLDSPVSGETEEKDEIPKLVDIVDGVSIEIRSSDKSKMVDDFFVSDIQITDKKIKFSVENRDEDYLQTISTIELVCEFKGEEGKYKPFSYNLYPVHNRKKIKDTEILFFPGDKINMEISLDDGTGRKYYIEKILFYITPREKIPIEMIKSYT